MFKAAANLKPTIHALTRWAERFPDFNIDEEYAKARTFGSGKLKKRLLKGLAHPKHREELKSFKRCYYLYSKGSGAVFVMVKPEVVITVLKMPPAHACDSCATEVPKGARYCGECYI